jgi:rRNA maturation RNase YbeY
VAIEFFSEDTSFTLKNKNKHRNWLRTILNHFSKRAGNINFIFCSDDYLLEINRSYLDHDYYTDIITFPYTSDPVSSDIYISIDRVQENAEDFGADHMDELRRVMAHGVLHLCGFGDKTEEEIIIMRKEEDQALSHWQALN